MGYIRDLAGIKNKDGKVIKKHFLLRSASLDNPTNNQLKFLKDIKLKRIIDLRNEAEAIHDPDVIIEGCKYYNFSLIDSDLNGVTHETKDKQLKMLRSLPSMEETYVDMLTAEYSLSNIKKAIREIVLNDEYPTIIHCATGKDRAGIIVAIILLLLDVDYETVVKDYMEQRKIYMKTAIKLGTICFIFTLNYRLGKKAYDYYAINRKFIDASFNAINTNFGSFDKFIHDYIGLTNEEINQFKEKALI